MSDNLSNLTFEQIKINQTKEFKITITELMIEKFSELSGDFSPIHMNENFAKSKKFNGRLVHGMLLASFLSRMVGMYLPGKHALYTSQSLEFHNPCFINDKITISSVITDKSEATKIIKINSEIINEKNEILLNGTGKIIVRDD